MYMVRVTVDTAAETRCTVGRLHDELLGSAAATDGLQHAYIELRQRVVVFCLYVQAADRRQAGLQAEQLCRRTMAAICGAHGWRVTSTRSGP